MKRSTINDAEVIHPIFARSPVKLLHRANFAPAGLVGNTPMLWVAEPLAASRRGFWTELEGADPGGNKTRSVLHLIEQAEIREDLRHSWTRPTVVAPGGEVAIPFGAGFRSSDRPAGQESAE
ncbi:hypothetical protein [Nocardia barduliensis]|uniref:hypothetical protein n=1 Tax=Nocardia barduliensis TaxID=2736643 RepID=UPI001572F4AD|nr:hypothetical protein [Nocardia barduliensis]